MKKGSFGSYGKQDKPRQVDDYYRSPVDAIDMLLSGVEFLPKGPVLDAGCGDGRLMEPLIKLGYEVSGIDLHDRNPPPYLPIRAGVDFLNPANALPGFRSVVTNPPYKLADAFIRRALDILPDDGEVHALLRHTWMCGQSRSDLLPCLFQITMCRRLKMLPADAEHEDKGHSGTTDFSWFSFQKGRTDGDTKIVHGFTKEK